VVEAICNEGDTGAMQQPTDMPADAAQQLQQLPQVKAELAASQQQQQHKPRWRERHLAKKATAAAAATAAATAADPDQTGGER
jgi:hypothetical protein